MPVTPPLNPPQIIVLIAAVVTGLTIASIVALTQSVEHTMRHDRELTERVVAACKGDLTEANRSAACIVSLVLANRG